MLLSVLSHWVHDLGWSVDVLLDMEHEVPTDLAAVGANVFPSADPKDYDFALVNTVVSAHFVEQLASKLPTVLWVHEGESVVWSSNWTVAQWRRFFRLPARTLFQTAWQSETVFKSFLTGTTNQVSCVRNGLPPLPERMVPATRTGSRKRIVCVGGVYGRKRPNDLVDAMIGLDREDVECLFVGTTEAIDTIGPQHVARIRERPDLFKLIGEVDRKTALQYVMSADVFALPSGDESQPIAPLEAASLGIPCVLTDLAPYAGTWRHGENCLLNPVGNTSLLRWNIRTLLEDDSVRHGIVTGAGELLKRFSIAAFHRRFDAEMPR
jgi:glycosyltransferase involved in cell wall biosynthesis